MNICQKLTIRATHHKENISRYDKKCYKHSKINTSAYIQEFANRLRYIIENVINTRF